MAAEPTTTLLDSVHSIAKGKNGWDITFSRHAAIYHLGEEPALKEVREALEKSKSEKTKISLRVSAGSMNILGINNQEEKK